MVQVKIVGADKTRSYLDGVRKRTIAAGSWLPRSLAFAVSRRTKALIKSEARYIGKYHRKTGNGLAESIIAKKVGNKRWVVGPDPIWSSLQSFSGKKIAAPHEYANYVEKGTRRSQPKRYFERGLKAASGEIAQKVNNAAKNIVRGN